MHMLGLTLQHRTFTISFSEGIDLLKESQTLSTVLLITALNVSLGCSCFSLNLFKVVEQVGVFRAKPTETQTS